MSSFSVSKLLSMACLGSVGSTLIVFISALGVPVQAENGVRRYPVTSDMVLSAMEGRQLPTDGVQLRMSAPITALSQNPLLEIQSISLTGGGSAELRVACRNHVECMPFYVAAAWPVGAERPNLNAKTSASPAIPAIIHEENTVHPGSRATLLIEDERIHIQVRVVTLEGGSSGDKIRVTTPDHRQSFTAEIVTSTLLKGSF